MGVKYPMIANGALQLLVSAQTMLMLCDAGEYNTEHTEFAVTGAYYNKTICDENDAW